MELGASIAEGADESEEAKSAVMGTRSVPLSSRVFYTSDEVRSFRTLGLEPGTYKSLLCDRDGPDIQLTAWLGIKLLGFKSRKELAFEDNIKHSFFIYPDEMVRHRFAPPGRILANDLLENLRGALASHTLGASVLSPHCSGR